MLSGVDAELIQRVADLLRERNAIDARIAQIIGRPVTSGYLGEWVASQIFDIELDAPAAGGRIDGRFRSGSLKDRTVSVKWHLWQKCALGTSGPAAPDYYLVLTGPPAPESRGTARPWCIDSVYLFDGPQVRAEQESGAWRLAPAVAKQRWLAAEIYPEPGSPLLRITRQQSTLLRLFGP